MKPSRASPAVLPNYPCHREFLLALAAMITDKMLVEREVARQALTTSDNNSADYHDVTC